MGYSEDYYNALNGNSKKKKKDEEERKRSSGSKNSGTSKSDYAAAYYDALGNDNTSDDDFAPLLKKSDTSRKYRDNSEDTVETTQEIYDKWGKYYNESDYDEYSKKGASIANPTLEDARGWLILAGNPIGGEKVGNKVTFSRDNSDDLLLAEAERTYYKDWKSVYRYMTDFEVGVYNYLLAKNGEESAQKFLDDIEGTLNARQGGEIAENVKNMDNGLLKAATYGATSLGAGVDSFGTGIKQLLSEDALPVTTLEVTNQILLEGLDGGAKNLYQAGNTVGNMFPSVAVGFLSPTVGRIVQGSSAAGNAYRQSLVEGKTKEEAATFGVMVGGLEFVTSKLLGSVGTMTGDLPKKALSKIATLENGLLRVGAKYAINLASEITEEEFQLWLEPAARWIAFGEDYDAPSIEEMAETLIVTGISTGILNLSTDIATGNLTKVDGLSVHEAKVIDAVVNEQIAAKETEGKKLTGKEKDSIREEVIDQMNKGQLDIDTIERTLGGKTYEEYTSLVKREKDLTDEISSLENTPETSFTVGQRERLTAAREELKNLPSRTDLKTRLGNEVYGIAKNTRLGETYAEKARRGQAFQADLTQYKGKQREAVERAIKSGVLNNTYRAHELVNTLSRLEADKGISFDYTNNAKLKESGFAIDGKVVNGFVKDGGVTLNVQSSKAWQTTVGHEITHVLEGTEAYSALRETLYAYAESKGELASRKAALTELYKDIKGADLDAELTADLVGDYLFSNKEFIDKLTGNRTLFQKVWDEVKYLCKVATGKELTEIEKVEREFARAWKEYGNALHVDNLFDDDSVNPFETDDSGEADLAYSVSVTDKSTLNSLNDQVAKGEYDAETNPDGGYYVTYKSMSFWGYDEDGNAILRSPMAEYVDGELSNAYLIPKDKSKLNWYQSTETIDEGTGLPTGLLVKTKKEGAKSFSYLPASENQDLIAEDWSNLYFNLRKKIQKNGKWVNSDVPARYNPYEHSSNSMLNDQFTAAYQRDNLVTVKMIVPISEDNGAYRAQWSKDATGWSDWKSGIVAGKIAKQKDLQRRVYLSRYAAPVEIVPDSEVAQAYKGYLEGTDVAIPDNVVSPNLLKELRNAGVPIEESGKVQYSASDSDSDNLVTVPNIQHSLSKDIENFDNSWYNEIKLSAAEQKRVQSEALTWNANKRNQLITQTLSNGITYRYVIDDDGIAHIYEREEAVDIHEREKEYDNANREEPDSVIEELGLGQGNNGEHINVSQNGRYQGKDDANDSQFVSGKGRGNRTGHSKNRFNAYGKPKKVGWHFNEDGSVEITYSDGSKEIENIAPIKEVSSTGDAFFDGENQKHSLSNEGEEYAPVGNYSTPLNETALEAPVAPVTDTNVGHTDASLNVAPEAPSDGKPDETAKPAIPKSERIANGSRSDELLYESLDNHPVQTIEQRIAEKIRATQGEIADNIDLRREAEAYYESLIADLRAKYNAKKNKNTNTARGLLQSISRQERLKATADANYSKRISDLEARVEKMSDPSYHAVMVKRDKMEADAKWAADLIGDTSTWKDKWLGLEYATNTERRNLRDIVRDANGNKDIARADAIDDALNGQYNREQAEVNRELAAIRKKYADLKITKAEDAYIQMLGELRSNPETTLTEQTVKEYYEKHKSKIDAAKVDKVIEMARQDYDELLSRVNAELKRQGKKEIPYRKGYFPHFTEPKHNFIQKLLNWKVQDNEIPTSIAGLTEDFKPTKSWQSFDKTRHSDETDYSFMKGFDAYSSGALDWIYHMDTLQKRRAVENHIRYTHSDEGVQKRIKEVYKNEDYDADEAQAEIEKILAEKENPLNNFIQDFMTHTNILAGKKNSLDRTVEQWTNRKIYSVMQNVQNRTSANMVLANVRSALTNFIPITQSWAQVSPLRSLQAAKETIANSIKDDGTVGKSTFLTNRLREADKLYKTNWDKVLDKAGIMFEIVDNFSSQVIWRSKYNQNLANGMSEAEAIHNADQFAENVMAGRSKGNEPTLFNAKNPFVKAFTMFQLEVNNQYGYLFKDVPTDLKAETEHWKFNLAKGYTTAFIGAYVYNALLEKVTGSDAALDPIGIIEDLLKDLGLFGDDEEEEPTKTALNLADNVAEELPFVGGIAGGGRIPISSAIPYGGEYGGGLSGFIEDFGNIGNGGLKNIGKEMMNPLLNVGLPVGGGQIKKTVQGLKMFSDEHPVSGSYTDSGNLRFPVEKTPLNIAQAAVFGQYASKNAREYFDNDYAPLKEKQIQEYIDVDMPISDYWKYREGLAKQDKLEDKFDYINDLDLPIDKKNILVNNVVDRKEKVDLTNYDDFASLEEFDYANKNPEKYKFLNENGIAYSDFANADEDTKNLYSNAYESAKKTPAKRAVARAVSDNYVDFYQHTRDINNIEGVDLNGDGKTDSGSVKENVRAYIFNELDMDYGAKCILFKNKYNADDSYNADIIDYLNNRDDLTYADRVIILTQLGFRVENGYIYAD